MSDTMTGRELIAFLELQSADKLDEPLYTLSGDTAVPITRESLIVELPREHLLREGNGETK